MIYLNCPHEICSEWNIKDNAWNGYSIPLLCPSVSCVYRKLVGYGTTHCIDRVHSKPSSVKMAVAFDFQISRWPDRWGLVTRPKSQETGKTPLLVLASSLTIHVVRAALRKIDEVVWSEAISILSLILLVGLHISRKHTRRTCARKFIFFWLSEAINSWQQNDVKSGLLNLFLTSLSLRNLLHCCPRKWIT